MSRSVVWSLLLALVLAGCAPTKPLEVADTPPPPPEVEESFIRERPIYNPSRTRQIDLLHTALDVRFDWKKQHVLGKAKLTFRPYFYATNKVTLDAKGFDIHQVEWVKNDSTTVPLPYTYDTLQLHLTFPEKLHRADTVLVAIDYTAKPNEFEAGGSAAITSDKGLYFINPLGEEKGKPQQIWTQGETEANSRWFPTIDSPNERMTQEITVTVQNRFNSLSNGSLIYSIENPDGTRTDVWRQEQAHAPYLVMLAIGEYAVVQDSWNEMPVNYFVEADYEPYARDIFGNTPEMLEFFSDILAVPYPWEKYHQVVVRDYVSGAMENTTAVIFGDFVHQTKREMLDDDNEDVVAHELFHHWFGDLVTCESWANLPLNESFATYGEYLWFEYKYGRDKADHHLQNDLNNYLLESRNKQVDMIRYDHADKENMFDSHSYAKGGRILHMLRKIVGDEAFFAGLKYYLEENAYTAVEIHDLRIAFEAVTGEDLNWFFNQWFLAQGHPVLDISYTYNDSLKQQTVTIEQKQRDSTPLYRLPMRIDLYHNKQVVKKEVVVDQQVQEFSFDVPSKPDLVNVDAEKYLLCRKNDQKSLDEFRFQYYRAPLYLDRFEALDACIKQNAADPKAHEVVVDALSDKYPRLRRKAIKGLENSNVKINPDLRAKLISIAEGDDDSGVRKQALATLIELDEDPALAALYQQALSDSSYQVVAQGLRNLVEVKPEQGLTEARKLSDADNSQLLNALAEIFSESGSKEDNAFFIQAYPKIGGFSKIGFSSAYTSYLMNLNDDESIQSGLSIFEDLASAGGPWWVRFYGVQTIKAFKKHYAEQQHELDERITKLEATDQSSMELNDARLELEAKKGYAASVQTVIDRLVKDEDDPRLIRVLTN